MPPKCAICYENNICYSNKCEQCKKCTCSVCFIKILGNDYNYSCPFCQHLNIISVENLNDDIINKILHE